MSLAAVNLPKYATVLNSGVGILGTTGSTVGATVLGIDGTASNAKVVYTAGAYGGIVESLMISHSDTAAVAVLIYILDGSNVMPLGIVSCPINSGNLSTALNVDAINSIQGLPLNSTYKKYIPLMPNASLKVAVLAAMNANKILYASATGIDFVA